MKPVETPSTNTTLVGAPGDDHVLPLPAWVGDGEVISEWEFDDEDRKKIAEGRLVGLGVAANPPPPIGMTIVAPHCPVCKMRMEWDERLTTWLCAHAEDGGPSL